MKFLFLSWVVFLFTLNVVASEQDESTIVYRVKAAYLLNFIRYTEWPLNKFTNTDDPVILCIFGNDPFGEILEQTFKDKDISGRNVQVRRIQQEKQLINDCHVLYMSNTRKNFEQELLKIVQNIPVLTVTDMNEFRDGVINFVRFENTIQFEINLKMANKVGLKLSSRMIPLAKRVFN